MIPKADSKMVLRAKAVVSREAGAVLKIAPQIDGRFVEIVEMLLGCNGHVLVAGVGTSAAVAERFAHLLSVCGTLAIFINVTNFLHGGSGAIRPEDILYVFSKGGQSDEVNKLVKIAQLKKAKVIAQTENAASPLGNMADVGISDPSNLGCRSIWNDGFGKFPGKLRGLRRIMRRVARTAGLYSRRVWKNASRRCGGENV